MSELYRIIRNFIVISLLVVMLTALFCGIIIAQSETSEMLFG